VKQPSQRPCTCQCSSIQRISLFNECSQFDHLLVAFFACNEIAGGKWLRVYSLIARMIDAQRSHCSLTHCAISMKIEQSADTGGRCVALLLNYSIISTAGLDAGYTYCRHSDHESSDFRQLDKMTLLAVFASV